MYEKILLPTDGSEESKEAVNHAEELAERFGAEIHVIHIVDIRKQAGEPRVPTQVESMRENGEKIIEETTESMEKSVKTDVRVGIPHQEINDYVEEHDIDLIAMGSHGRSGLNRMLLGSVTEKVLRTCSVPILTVQNESE